MLLDKQKCVIYTIVNICCNYIKKYTMNYVVNTVFKLGINDK